MKLTRMVLAIFLLIFSFSCGKESATSDSAAPTAQPAAVTSSGATPAASGILTADPNPVRVCDGSKLALGVTTLSWEAKEPGKYSVYVVPPGKKMLFAARSGHSPSTSPTRNTSSNSP